MNLQNVSQREVLAFDQFIKKVHDNNYKPLAPSNQSQGGLEKSGLSPIKREPEYDHVGYADAYFAGTSKINIPGVRVNFDGKQGMIDSSSFGTTSISQTSESEESPKGLKRLSDF